MFCGNRVMTKLQLIVVCVVLLALAIASVMLSVSLFQKKHSQGQSQSPLLPPLRTYDSNNKSILHFNKIQLMDLIEIVLQGSVQITDVSNVNGTFGEPFARSMSECALKRNLLENQHSPELWIPNSLHNHKFNKLLKYPGIASSTLPLFYYVEAYPFVSLTCTTIGGEDWKSFRLYWDHVMKYITNSKAWIVNGGLDFFLPATHPLLPAPCTVGEHIKSAFAHATFFTTDYDGYGTYPRDVIVPYKSDLDTRADSMQFQNRPITLFLACPALQATRIRVLTNMQPMSASQDVKVINITANYLPIWEYLSFMHHAKFCLHVRGDTVSSRRFFSSVNAGCIPVIVADWMELPYERFIDYSKFTITLQESDIYNHPQKVLDKLRSISTEQLTVMQQHLSQAKKYLMYDSSDVINPISLMFAEAFMKRLDHCSRRRLVGQGRHSFCNEVIDRAKVLQRERPRSDASRPHYTSHK